jgi:hypothetical protein
MSMEMDEEIRRWTARRKSALILGIIQGWTTVSELYHPVRSSAFGD